MKKIIILLALFTLVIAGTAFAGVIKNSKHDLSSGSTGATVKAAATGGTTEICVFCHTPHTATTLSGAPLWNNLVTTQTFTAYGTTVGGTVITGTPDGSTKACMSCHDGVTAINSLYNVPGSGVAGTITMVSGTVDAADGSLLTSSNGNLGIDMSNDHPVSFVYDASKGSLRTLTGSGTIAKVTGAAAVTGGTGAKMECASCHSVHDPDLLPFLRLSNVSSGLCLACHQK